MNIWQWVGLVVFVVFLYVLWQIRQILLLLFTAVVLATALNFLVRLLQRYHIRRGWAIVLSVGLLLALLIGFFVGVVPPLIEQLRELVDLVPAGLDQVQSWADWLQEKLPGQVMEEIRSLRGLTQQLQSMGSRLLDNFFTLFSDSLGVLLNCLLVLVLSIMLLTKPKAYRQGFILLIPSFYRRRVDDILQQCEVALGGWAIGILFNMSVIVVLSLIGLWILQVPLPLACAILAGLLTFIPSLGPVVSVIPPMALALLDAPWKAVAVIGLYILIQQIESNLLTPLVMQKQVDLLPAVTLAFQLIFASFFGFLGLFLALPLLVVFQVWVKELLIKDVLNHLHGPESAKSLPALAEQKNSQCVKDEKTRTISD
ncbi:MAG: AI-2E family transporter [Microcystaceae cyanobacterium]